MKRIFLFSACVLLAACGGGSARSGCEQDYWDGTVGTCLPEGWEIIDKETLRQRGVPEETIVAFQISESVSGQFPTVAVTKERLPNPVTAQNYSSASIRSIEVMEGYTLVDSKDFTVDGEDVSLHIFTAQPIEGEPRRRFFQVSTAIEDIGFTATAVSPVSITKELEEDMMLILEHLVFSEPIEEEK
ncbi:hypothetical protein HOL63_01080 [Candidatus Peregrinibacteria bacterium]|jgi:hypothetical protein|nr:hypothetical protein [Candidatus Peregrinibacteria bacterium]MBT5468325.1 hypothetical protein [Candidatus Peregrinibacteria bacterium]MBT7337221.1 hypothetical protein [Candidatus Peregrinibacteria bacterium]